MSSPPPRHARVRQGLDLLKSIQRGIEKEGLRVDPQGKLALTPHPQALGSALTNSRVTTDYSEALLELITGTHTSVESLLQELEETQDRKSTRLNSSHVKNSY